MFRRTFFLAAVILILASIPSPLFGQCGVERWSVKTGTDADSGTVSLNSSTNTTVTSMRAFSAPNPIPANNRVSPAETTVWVINATLTEFKLENDSDYHLVIKDSAGNTMVTEIPSPSCVGAGSPFLSSIQNARAEFDAQFTATTSFQTVNIPVQIKGVGMFDFLHGQTGVAPNGIELHPILDIVFNPGASTPDFSLNASPASLSMAQGGSGSSTISTAVTGGFNSAIALSVSGLPSGVTASFSPSSIAAPGNGGSTLTFSASSTAATGTFNATVTATGGGVTHTAPISLTVTAAATPNFTVSASPASLSVTRGGSGNSTISTAVSGGFNSAVALSVSGLPSGVTASFTPTSIGAPGGGSSTLKLSASSAAATGTTTLTVTASGGGITHTTTVALTVSQAGLGIPPPDHIVIVMEENHSFSNIIGSSSAPFINSLAQQGALFTQSFAIEHPSEPNYLDLFSGSNQGVTDDSCPHTFSGENIASELTAAGLSFTGFSEDLPSAGSTVCTSGAYARKHAPWINFSNVPTSANLPFTSFPTDFTTLPTISIVDPNLNDDMHDGTIAQGDTWLQQHMNAYIQFAQTHNSLLIVTWDEDDNSSSNQIPTIFVGPMVKQGQFSETINHFTVLRTLEDLYGLTHAGSAATATPISDVWKQATPDFTVSASPASLSVNQGSSTSTTITTAISGGFNSSVSFSTTGLPGGVTASFSSSSIAAPGSGSATLTLTASSTATVGTANVTVTASGGGVTHTATVALTVASTTTADFAISVAPASVSIVQGSAASATVSTTVSGGFNSAIALSASGLPSGVTPGFNPTSIAVPGSGSSSLTFTASSTAVTGTSTVTVTASGGGVTHTATISLTVVASGGGGGTTQILGNPGFENGSSSPTPWTVSTTASTPRVINNSSTEPPHSGQWDAWLDGHAATTTDSILQQVAIPANATAASLSFFLHIDTAETSTTRAFDTLTVQVRNTSGTVLSTLKTFSNLNAASGYQQQTFDLTSFKGQTIQIFLQGKEDSLLQTSFVLDDFALNITTPSTDTTPPTTSITAPANGSTVSGAVTVTSTASDNVGVTQMQILIDGNIVTSNTNATSLSFNWSTLSVANGSHTIVSKAFDAAGNVGTSATVTVTVSNSTGTTTELIVNGGFENGSSAPAPWTTTAGVINNSSSEPPHAGSWDAWMDGYGTTHTDTLAQQVTIPANATAATLTFWLHIDTAETSTTTAFDTLTVQVLNSSGTALSTLATFSNLNAASGYQQKTFDLSSFTGQTIQIFLKGVEDSIMQTSFVVDDVSLKVTQ